jgi:NAD(P)-dependent dehydrogenase (short-subunit alcohol dehydrogenase family)
MHLLRPFKHISYTSRAFALTRNPQLPTILSRMSSSMAQRLKGKTIVITGASSGIGKSTAIEFARTQPDDLKLILTARREALKEVAKEIEGFAKGVKVLPVKLDISKVEEIEAFLGNLPEDFKNVDVLVNNAFVSPNSHPHPPNHPVLLPSKLI